MGSQCSLPRATAVPPQTLPALSLRAGAASVSSLRSPTQAIIPIIPASLLPLPHASQAASQQGSHCPPWACSGCVPAWNALAPLLVQPSPTLSRPLLLPVPLSLSPSLHPASYSGSEPGSGRSSSVGNLWPPLPRPPPGKTLSFPPQLLPGRDHEQALTVPLAVCVGPGPASRWNRIKPTAEALGLSPPP